MVETGTSDEMVNNSEGARIPRLLRVDDLLPTYFTSPRPSAWRLLPKTFAPTIPLSDFRLIKNRPWEAEGESEREPKYVQTPNIT